MARARSSNPLRRRSQALRRRDARPASRFALLAFACWLVAGAVATAADWPLFGGDAARSATVADTAISPTTVARLAERWKVTLGGVVDAAPIVVGARVYATDKAGTTYALSTSNGHVLWKFSTSGPKITTSVPAYDPTTRQLYVPGVDGKLHRLDAETGRELVGRGFPATLTSAPDTEKDASSLNLASGYLYAQTSGYIGDAPPYVGHVVAVRLSDGTEHVFNTLCAGQRELIDPQTCSEQRSGMWSRAGVVVDPDSAMHGRIYAATGNARYDPAQGDYGDTILALSADASRLLGAYAPADAAALDANDRDVGSSSPALLPRQSQSATPLMAVQAGKDEQLKLLDRAHLGGPHALLQSIGLGEEVFSAPAVWTSHGVPLVVYGLADGVRAYRLVTSNGKSRLVAAWQADAPTSSEGSSPVIAGGVVFVAGSNDLSAFEAATGRRVWRSTAIGPIHWQSPAIANGVVYCADQNGVLHAFALR